MNYVDGFVVAVPTSNKDAYIHHARLAAEIFREHGALRITECWGDDVPDGKLTSFPGGQAGTGGNRGVLLDRVALPRGARRRHAEGDGRPAPEKIGRASCRERVES